MRRRVILTAAMVVLGVSAAMLLRPPKEAEPSEAIGSTQSVSEPLKAALEPASEFEPLPAPGPNDWLAVHQEPGQTFDEFVASHPNRPDSVRHTIYLQPLGDFPEDKSPSLELLREYAAAYFGMAVVVLPALQPRAGVLTTRINPNTFNTQILTTDVLALLQKNLPADAFCVLAVTMQDLYPEPSWNFVFGQASLQDRAGVYSFARYDPAFYGEERSPDYQQLILRRSCRILVHETAHMFGLTHCIYYSCVENGSNHLAESDARPMHMCPVCLRKLQYSIGFEPERRYRDLLGFYQRVGFDDEAQWVQRRLDRAFAAPA